MSREETSSTTVPTHARESGSPRTFRVAAALALGVLGAGLVVVLALTTPWHPLHPAATHPPADFTAAEVARAGTFYAEMRPLSFGSLAAGLAIFGILGLTSVGARVVAVAARPFGGHWVWRVAVGAVALSVAHTLLLLPFGIRAELLRREYGLSTQAWGGWMADLAKSFGVETGLLVLAFLALYLLIRWLPRFWWAPAAAGGFVLVVVGSFVYPVVVEPVFNSFRAMPRSELRAELFQLAADDGVPVQRVLIADASRRTTAVNAYVSGFGSTRRIVVYDTLLKSSSDREVKLIVAHELGHAQERDVLYGTLVGALGAAAGVCLLYLVTSSGAVTRRAGVASLADARSVGLLLLLVNVLTVASMPVQNLISRQIEARADVHALNQTGDPLAYARMQHDLAVRNLAPLRPGPAAYYLYASHPTAPQRIALARAWALAHDRPALPPLTEP